MPKILSSQQIDHFRERLIDVAERLFAAHGPEAVSLRQLAAELGVSPMTPYRYFTDKDAILAAIRARGFDRFAQALEAALASTDDLDARARAATAAYVRFAFQHPAAYRLMFDLTQPGEAGYPDLLRASARARATMTVNIRAMIAAGMIEGDPLVLGHAFWAAMHGLIVLKMADKLSPEADFEAILAATVGGLRRGFARG
jgi:AcrR family transcriptional regulator